jgi:hypothetical protein
MCPINRVARRILRNSTRRGQPRGALLPGEIHAFDHCAAKRVLTALGGCSIGDSPGEPVKLRHEIGPALFCRPISTRHQYDDAVRSDIRILGLRADVLEQATTSSAIRPITNLLTSS